MSSPDSAEFHAPNLPYARQWINPQDLEAVLAVLRSDQITRGCEVEAFESEVAGFCGAQFGVAASSGTTALQLAFLALGVKPGTIGIVPDITFVATANAMRLCGAEVLFADVDPETGLIDPSSLEDSLGIARRDYPDRDLVFASVSLAGDCSLLPKIDEIGKRYGAIHVEDAAHSLGAVYRLGSATHLSASCAHSRAAILSFHPAKHITTGEGGMVMVNDPELDKRLRSYRNHGFLNEDILPPELRNDPWAYQQSGIGVNAWMTAFQAALGRSQLRRLPGFLERRREIAKIYTEQLGRPPFSDFIKCRSWAPNHAYHLFVVHWLTPELRRHAWHHLRKEGIQTQVHYLPIHRQAAQKMNFSSVNKKWPGADNYYDTCLSLPLFPAMTDADVVRVLDSLEGFCALAS